MADQSGGFFSALMGSNQPSIPPGTPVVIVQNNPPGFFKSWQSRLLMALLALSILFNISLYNSYHEYFANVAPPIERFHSGNRDANERILILKMTGTIMPPFTERLIEEIDHAAKDDDVKGVMLSIDSPGGIVADSHEIYHRLKKLSAKKPVFVQMHRMAASGGYYIAMGAGPEARIFAEPTTWTGSIGVIIPRYEFGQLAERIGIKSEPLKTGEFKDALNPFQPLTDNERTLWMGILDQAFQKFVDIIDENRPKLDREAVKTLATGQIYTADDAIANGLVDEIGFLEESLEALKKKAGVENPRVVTYEAQKTLMDVILGQVRADQSRVDPLKIILESSVPRAMYLCSWSGLTR